VTTDARPPLWVRALTPPLPARDRDEVLDDLLDERQDQMARGRSRIASGLWLAVHLLRSAASSRRVRVDITIAPRRLLLADLWLDLRYAARAGRDDDQRNPARVWKRGLRDRNRRGARAGAVCRPESIPGHPALRVQPLDPKTFAFVATVLTFTAALSNRFTRLAGDANRSGDGAED
jgi:hypothetical protein